MEVNRYLEILGVFEKLKNNTRHSFTSSGRKESVAEHSHRLAVMAYFVKDEYPDADIGKVILMCLFHDLGEAFTGDVPSFEKTGEDEAREKKNVRAFIDELPPPYRAELSSLFDEMEGMRTPEAKLFKALDNMEAVIQHNEADISTWLENEYDLNLHHAEDAVAFSPYLTALRQCIREETIEKIAHASNLSSQSGDGASAP